MLARLRAVVPTWETYGTQGSDYSYDIPTIEEPGRAITQLRNLARGHALSKGRNYITSEDIPLVIKVVLSTAPIARATIFDILISHKGSLTTSEITSSLNITPHTAHRTMTQLNALGLAYSTGLMDKPNAQKKIVLKPEFSWFLSEEFQRLRERFDSEEEQQQQPRQQEAETELEEKGTLSTQKNQNTITDELHDETVAWEKLEEKCPPTSTNLAFDDNQQFEEHEEKIPLNAE